MVSRRKQSLIHIFRPLQSIGSLADKCFVSQIIFCVNAARVKQRCSNIKRLKKIILHRTLSVVVTAATVLKDNLITDFLTFFNSNFKLNYPSSTGSGKSCFLLLVKFRGLGEMARNSTFQRNILCEKTFCRCLWQFSYFH